MRTADPARGTVVKAALLDAGVVGEEGRTLRFVTNDGRTIPRNGYRLEDFVDDDIGADDDASRDGFCTTTVQRDWEHAEVREAAAVYRLKRRPGYSFVPDVSFNAAPASARRPNTD